MGGFQNEFRWSAPCGRCYLSRCRCARCLLRGAIRNTPHGDVARNLKKSVDMKSKVLVAFTGCILSSSQVVSRLREHEREELPASKTGAYQFTIFFLELKQVYLRNAFGPMKRT